MIMGVIDFPPSEFDQWAPGYDESVYGCHGFPFERYNDLLELVVDFVNPRKGIKVLDLGTGTGNLAEKLVDHGCEVIGTDFSPAMLEIARRKVPKAKFFLHDVREPLSSKLMRKYDVITMVYLLHHFPVDEKIRIINGLLMHLMPNGEILIADIMFTNRRHRETVSDEYKDDWEVEYYWEIDKDDIKFKEAGIRLEYHRLSNYLGIIRINKQSFFSSKNSSKIF